MSSPLASDRYEKSPFSTLDYLVDWSAWLQDGETIVDKNVITVGPINVDTSTVDTDGRCVTVWLSGGEVGKHTSVTVRVTTNQGRTESKTFRLVIKER